MPNFAIWLREAANVFDRRVASRIRFHAAQR
jgi:hypothetical protein